MIKIGFILCYFPQLRSQSPNFDNSELAFRSKVVEEKLNSKVASLRRANKRQWSRIFDRQNKTLNWQCASLGRTNKRHLNGTLWSKKRANTLNWPCTSLGQTNEPHLSEILWSLKRVNTFIDNVRHWGEQISVIWAEFFNLQNVSIPLLTMCVIGANK